METLSLPLGCPTLMSALCSHTFACTVPFPGKPFPPLPIWQTFILQTSLGGTPLEKLPRCPTLMLIIPSPSLLSPPSSHHLNHVPGSPVASPYNVVESLWGGGGPQCLPSLLSTIIPGFAPRPAPQVRSRLGAALTWGKILFMSPAPSSSLQPWQCGKLARFPACHQGQPGGGMTGGLSWPHPPCG